MRGRRMNRNLRGGVRLRSDGSLVRPAAARLTRGQFVGGVAAGVGAAAYGMSGVAHPCPPEEPPPEEPCWETIMPLRAAAGQDDPKVYKVVGEVRVWHDETNLHVIYTTTGGWCLELTHLWVGDTLLDDYTMTTKGKNAGIPIQGHFPFASDKEPDGWDLEMSPEGDCVTEHHYTIPLDLLGIEDLNEVCEESPLESPKLFIVPHADVKKTTVTPVSPDLSWSRTDEPASKDYATPGYGGDWDPAWAFANVDLDYVDIYGMGGIWDNGYVSNDSPNSGTGEPPPEIEDRTYASWYYSYKDGGSHDDDDSASDLRRFQATFSLPEGCSVTGGSLHVEDHPNAIPINDNIYIFVNGPENLLFWGGTRVYTGEISFCSDPPAPYICTFQGVDGQPTLRNTDLFPETDGWYIEGTIPEINNFQPGFNQIDIFTEENERWGGMSKLVLDLECTTIESETAFGGNIYTKDPRWWYHFTHPLVCCVDEIFWPPEGTAYIGYEDRTGGDFDYNDFGMTMQVREKYVNGLLSEIDMTFVSLYKEAGDTHDIHIFRDLNVNTTYTYTIDRSEPAQGTEDSGSWGGSGGFEVTLFDTEHFTAGNTVTIHIEMIDKHDVFNPSPTPPRWDLDGLFAYYDPYMYDKKPGIEAYRHIGDWQPFGSHGFDVPYILVVPIGWYPPDEGTTITDPYAHFYDYYSTSGGSYNGDPDPWWYEVITNACKGDGGLIDVEDNPYPDC